MSDVVSWNLQVSVSDTEGFRTLMEEMVESTRAEAGTLGYEWFISEDGAACHINERYADSAALMEHVGNFGAQFAERFMALCTPTSFSLYGNASDEVREALEGFAPNYLGNFGGFSR